MRTFGPRREIVIEPPLRHKHAPGPPPTTAPPARPRPLVTKRTRQEIAAIQVARQERKAARAEAHESEICRLLDEAARANNGRWPQHVHKRVAATLGISFGSVHAWIAREIARGVLTNPRSLEL
jgi:hypothetical protein